MLKNNIPKNVAVSGLLPSIVITIAISISLSGAFAAEKTPSDKQAPVQATNDLAQTLKEKWGIEIFGPFLSAGGSMVDFRYKVLDPEKAAPLAKRENKPVLINQATGAKLLIPNTPTLGSLRQMTSKPMAGRVYFMLFANTQKHIKAGDKVTISAGDLKIENLNVE